MNQQVFTGQLTEDLAKCAHPVLKKEAELPNKGLGEFFFRSQHFAILASESRHMGEAHRESVGKMRPGLAPHSTGCRSEGNQALAEFELLEATTVASAGVASAIITVIAIVGVAVIAIAVIGVAVIGVAVIGVAVAAATKASAPTTTAKVVLW